MNDFSDPI